jgi:hypothetical protein
VQVDESGQSDEAVGVDALGAGRGEPAASPAMMPFSRRMSVRVPSGSEAPEIR